MTECHTQAIKFSRLPRRQVVADFQGGRLTSDAGLLLLREADRRLGLVEVINGCLHDPRDPRYVVHEQQALLAQRIFAVAAGYEDLHDHPALRDDPALPTATGQAPEPEEPRASTSTLCRLKQRVTRQALVEMSKRFVERFLKSFEQPPVEIILDVDATDDPSRLMAGRRNTARPAGGAVRSRRRSARLFPGIVRVLWGASVVCVAATGQHRPGQALGSHRQTAVRPHPSGVARRDDHRA